MKRLLLTISFVIAVYGAANAQFVPVPNTTDIFFNTGNVGIGKAPVKALDILGSQLIKGCFSLTYPGNAYSGAIAFNRDADAGPIYNNTMSAFQINGRPSWLEFVVFDPTGACVAPSALVVANTGNIGIGTTAPQSLLELRKDNVYAAGAVLELTNGTGGTGTSSEIYFSTYSRNGTNPSARIKVADDGDYSGNISFDTKGAFGGAPLFSRMYIESNTGNVGIGTIYPGAKLDIQGTLSTGGDKGNLDPNGGFNLSAVLQGTGQMLTGWNRTGGAGEADFINNKALGSSGGFSFYDYSNAGLLTQLMWIHADGTVGIGTPDPNGYKLAVNGNIHAKQVNVDLIGWSDYVFNPTYRLMPLAQVKTYIDQNHHLPEIPSAADVEKDGLNLGEMNKLLLKKVEELTLYLIELKDQKDNEKTELDAQKKQMKKLQQQLNSILNKK